MVGNVEELTKQLAADPPEYSFAREFAAAFARDVKAANATEADDVEIYDDMSSPLPGLSIAPAGVVGMNSK